MFSEFVVGYAGAGKRPPEQRLTSALRAIRSHLGMEVAFVSEFADGRRIFRHVDSTNGNLPVYEGGSDPLEQSYCQRVVDGRLPELILDATKVPAALELPATEALPVGAHLSVPIELRNGRIYGTLCCFSCTPNLSLNDRDLSMMRIFAQLMGEQIEEDIEASRSRREMEDRINVVLSGDFLSMVYQPIFHVGENRIIGFESLARFSAVPTRTPDIWFSEAAQVGCGIQLETKAIRQALAALAHLPEDVYVSVNTSPEMIITGELEDVFEGCPLERIVLEVTEHAVIDAYSDIAAVIGPLRNLGLRIAVDDAGAGYASFRHILSLTPDVIKLDISITRNIDTDRSRRALAAALIGFAQATGSKVVAEGVETAGELSTLRQLGVHKAQGYFLGKPMTIESAAKLAKDASPRVGSAMNTRQVS
jgi:EAL domain-containing protein (putative c-di-GMP-specific phosphodiesterase class I)